MEGMGLILIPVILRCCLGPLSMFGPMPWLTFFGVIASPDCPNKGFNLPLAAHPPPSHTPSLSHLPHHPPPLYTYMPLVILQWLWKSYSKSSRNSCKTLAKDCFSYTVYLAWLKSSTTKPQWFQYLKLIFLEIPSVKIWSVFQNQVTYKSL